MILNKLFFLLATLFLLQNLHATEKKVVNFYNWSDFIGPDTLDNFEKEYGIKVNYDIYDTPDIVDAKLLTGRSGYDVVLHAASYSARLIDAGIFQPLDRSKLTNWHHLDPDLMLTLEDYDPGNRYIVPYMWGTTGISYNIDMLKERMPDVPLDTADFFFKPEIISRFADCGVTILDSPLDVIPMTLNYLGYHANSINPRHLKEAEGVIKSIRPYIRYFSAGKMLIDMPNREICVAMSWSGDYAIAKARAKEAGLDINLGYSMLSKAIPAWFDAVVIPSDAPNPDNAHLLINYLMRPEVIAPITDFTGYANGNKSATPLVDPKVTGDPAIYPDENVRKKLQPSLVYGPKKERIRSRTWIRMKTGI
jgi:putrescine transport system substrate-binding protein